MRTGVAIQTSNYDWGNVKHYAMWFFAATPVFSV